MSTTKEFNAQTPPRIQALIGQGESLATARLIEDRTTALIEKQTAHFERHKAAFIARETLKVFEEQHGHLSLEYRPNWAVSTMGSYRQEAKRRVGLRQQGKINQIRDIGKEMQRQLPKYDPRPTPTPQGKRLAMQELFIIDLRHKTLKRNYNAHFKKNSDLWLIKQYDKNGNAHALPFMMRHQKRMWRIDAIALRMKQQVQYNYGLRASPPKPHHQQRDVSLTPEHLPF